jgi:hypothetical protein
MLLFKERSLTIEATSQEQFEFLVEGFRAVVEEGSSSW